jgi:hypothetical protein
MNRERLLPFVLGFVAGALFILLTGGIAGGALAYTMYQRELVAEQQAIMEKEQALENERAARRREEENFKRAEQAVRDIERARP